MDAPREFICLDCGILVVSFAVPAANDQALCGECIWLRDIEDDAERERLRAWLRRDR
jgi:hypothetical protein